jgi:hypothetical protein
MIKRYIGDGVYVSYDGFSITLTTENWTEVINTIVLEPEVVGGLERFIKDCVRIRCGFVEVKE